MELQSERLPPPAAANFTSEPTSPVTPTSPSRSLRFSEASEHLGSSTISRDSEEPTSGRKQSRWVARLENARRSVVNFMPAAASNKSDKKCDYDLKMPDESKLRGLGLPTSLAGRELRVTLDASKRLTITWDAVKDAESKTVLLDKGTCKLIEFPLIFEYVKTSTGSTKDDERAGPELPSTDVPKVAAIIEVLVGRWCQDPDADLPDEKREPKDPAKLVDSSGARLIHCLLLANEKESLELAMRLFRLRPRLLLDVHTNEFGFGGEGSLHILAANCREDELVELLTLARSRLADSEFLALLSQAVHGTFFEDPPMCNFGRSPVAYFASFKLRRVLHLLFGTGPPPQRGAAECRCDPVQGALGARLVLYEQLGESPCWCLRRSAEEGEELPLLTADERARLMNGDLAKGVCEVPRKTLGHQLSPLHAVIARNLPEMFDFLVNHCGACAQAVQGDRAMRSNPRLVGLRSSRLPTSGPVEMPALRDHTGCTPLQLAARLGMDKMFRHILQKRTRTEWTWGPVSERHIPLEEIDSANSHNERTVMELICHSSACPQSKALLLPSFMKGFLYGLYVQKWHAFGRWVFLARLLVHLGYVMLVTLIAAPTILRPSVNVEWLSSRGVLGDDAYYSASRTTQQDVDILLEEESRPGSAPSLSESAVAVLTLFVLALLLLLIEVTEFGLSCATTESKPLEESGERNFSATLFDVKWIEISISLPKTIGALRMMNERGGHILLVSIFCARRGWNVKTPADVFSLLTCAVRESLVATSSGSIATSASLFFDCPIASLGLIQCTQGDLESIVARDRGSTRTLLAVSALTGWLSIITEAYKPYETPATFQKIVVATFISDVGKFAAMYIPILIGFATAINALVLSSLGWSTRWSNWWLTVENLALLSFIQEPPTIGDDAYPSSIAQLMVRTEPGHQVIDTYIPTIVFSALFFGFCLVTVILLVNLLIAMINQTYDERKKEALLNHRIAFARLVLRFERLIEMVYKNCCTCSMGTKKIDFTQVGRKSSRRGMLSRYQSFRVDERDVGDEKRQRARRQELQGDLFADSAVHNVDDALTDEHATAQAPPMVEQRLEAWLKTAEKRLSTALLGQDGAESAAQEPSSYGRDGETRESTSRMQRRRSSSAGAAHAFPGSPLRSRAVSIAPRPSEQPISEEPRGIAQTPSGRFTDEWMDPTELQGIRLGESELLPFITKILGAKEESELPAPIFDKSQDDTDDRGGATDPLAGAVDASGPPDPAVPAPDRTPLLTTLDKMGDDGHKEAGHHVIASELWRWAVDRLREEEINKPVVALLIVDVQDDMINGTLALHKCPAREDGASVVPVINDLRKAVKDAPFGFVGISQLWHPKDSSAFHDNVMKQGSDVAFFKEAPKEGVSEYGRVLLAAPDNKTPMTQVVWPRHCVQDMPGANLHKDLVVEKTDVIIRRGTDERVGGHSAFFDNARRGGGPRTFDQDGTERNMTLLQELRKKRVTHVYVCGLALDGAVAYTALDAAERGFVTSVIEDACRSASLAGRRSQRARMERAGVQFVQSDEVPAMIATLTLTDALDQAIRASTAAVHERARGVAWATAAIPTHRPSGDAVAGASMVSAESMQGHRHSQVRAGGDRTLSKKQKKRLEEEKRKVEEEEKRRNDEVKRRSDELEQQQRIHQTMIRSTGARGSGQILSSLSAAASAVASAGAFAAASATVRRSRGSSTSNAQQPGATRGGDESYSSTSAHSSGSAPTRQPPTMQNGDV